MGQRLVISEAEKKRIIGLYGVVNINESTPPDESILIANKNPWKYTEYASARRYYSTSLKDGDRFVQIPWEKKSELISYLKDKLNSKFKGKSIRVINAGNRYFLDRDGNRQYFSDSKDSDDAIIHIDEIENIDIKDKNVTDLKTQCLVDLDFIGKVNDSTLESKFYFTIGSDILRGWESGLNRKHFEFKLNNFQSFSSEIYSVTNWNLLPDEYFEIKEIKRQQTDF